MLDIRVQDMAKVVEGVLGDEDGCSLKKVLYLNFNIRFNTDGDFDTPDVEACIHMMFYRPGNYVRVLGAVDGQFWLSADWKEVDQESWTLEAEHDSCWRSDGFSIFREVYRSILRDDAEYSSLFAAVKKEVKIDKDKLDSSLTLTKVKVLDAEEVAHINFSRGMMATQKSFVWESTQWNISPHEREEQKDA